MAQKFSYIGGLNKKNIKRVPVGRPIMYKIKDLDGNAVRIAKNSRVFEKLKEYLPGVKGPLFKSKPFSIKQSSSIESAERKVKYFPRTNIQNYTLIIL